MFRNERDFRDARLRQVQRDEPRRTTQEIATVSGLQAALDGKLTIVAAPAAANSTGVAGTAAFDSGFFYVCVATDTWERVALATW